MSNFHRDKLETWREHFFEEHGRAMAAKFRSRGRERFGEDFYRVVRLLR